MDMLVYDYSTLALLNNTHDYFYYNGTGTNTMYNYDDMENYYTLYQLSQLGEYKIRASTVLLSQPFKRDSEQAANKDAEFKLDPKLNQ